MNCLIKLLFNKHLLKYLKRNFKLLNYFTAIGLQFEADSSVNLAAWLLTALTVPSQLF